MPPSTTIPELSFFEENYNLLRRREGRIFSDEEVQLLPSVSRKHPLRKEWRMRSRSCTRLMAWLRKKEMIRILEAGCGNGWLSHRLSDIPGTEVVGMDINGEELSQAKRVFSGRTNLQFVHANLAMLRSEKFDVIVFASSIQYFPSLPGIIHEAQQQLRPGGEIHIIDSPLYETVQREPAQKRSAAYFEKMGFREMNDFYFHHGLEELDGFHHRILYDPRSHRRGFFSKPNPFFWVCINGVS
jgi:SAM-dependent methyltransferase